ERGGDCLEGAFIAVAIADRRDLLDRVRDLMARVPTDSRAAAAAAWALGVLGDESSLALAFLTEQLDVPAHRWHARCALVDIGTDAALAAVRRSLSEDFDARLAVSVFARTKEPTHLIGMLVEHLRGLDPLGRTNCLS